ncbi:T9SS type A sorting domain-containing protein, partial [Hyunsoonleella sp. SJ7]
DSVEISATEDGNQVVPDGYSKIFVLTMGEALLIKGVNMDAPVFEVTEPGMYTIHTLVFDGRSDSPNFLDLGVVGPTTTGVDVLNIVIENGLCASLDVTGAPVYVEEADSCDVSAGTLTASAEEVCSTGEVVISAHPNNDAIIPNDYSVLYVLTQGEGLIIRQISETPEFTVVGGGHYTIHTFVFSTGLDLSGVVPNVTTGFDVNALLIQGGGELCAALDVAGAPISITNPNAGTLTAIDTNVALTGGVAMLYAQPNDDAIIPNDYSVLYVLTQGEELIIRQIENTPEFTVTEPGNYTIHTLIYPIGLDLSAVVPNVTTGFDVNSLLVQGGGELCASLDVAGAPIQVEAEECTAFSGKMYSPKSVVCLENGVASLYAKFNRNPNIPKGYKQLFVLTDAFTLTVLQVSGHPEFNVDGSGFYRIHSLVYNPDTLDLSVVKFGETTGFDVLNLIEENGICASLHVKGAINLVIGSKWFCYFFNKYRAKNNSNLTSKGTNDDDLEGYVGDFDSYDEFEASFVEQNDEVRFYPNPVVNDLNVEIRLFENEEIEYSIVDMKGRAIISGSAEDLKFGRLTINTNRFANGMYIINFVSEMRTITKKIMIEK